MNLIIDNWNEQNGKEFQQYLVSLSNTTRVEWTQKIINTKMVCLAIPSPTIKKIGKEILKGNYLSFLKLWLWDYYDNTAIIGFIISNIKKDFSLYKKWLIKYAMSADNWATCDTVTYPINRNNVNNFIELSKELVCNEFPFVRRIGVDILFKLVDKEHITIVFDIIKGLTNESEYYVNMAIAWLICDCFIKMRDETLALFEKRVLNAFTNNKAISKCRDSFRISKEDKDLLLKYKIK